MPRELDEIEFISHLPRYTLRLSALPTTSNGLYDVTSADYQWSMFWIAMPGACLALLLFTILVLLACCKRCCRKQTLPKTCTHLLQALLTMGLAAAAGYFVIETYLDASSALSTLDGIASEFDKAVKPLHNYSTFVPDTTTLRSQLLDDPDMLQSLDIAVSYLQSTAEAFQALRFPSLAARQLRLESSNALFTSLIVISVILSVSLLTSLVLFFGSPSIRTCMLRMSQLLAPVAMVLCILMATFSLAALVPAHDMCPQSGAYAAAFGKDHLDFFIDCPRQYASNPYAVTFTQSDQWLADSISSLQALEQRMQQQGLSLYYADQAIAHVRSATNILLSRETTIVSCNYFYEKLDNVMDTACGDVSDRVFVGLWILLALGLAHFFNSILLLFFPAESVTLDDGSDDSEDEEHWPLLRNRRGSLQEPSPKTCQICITREVVCAFQPCGHVTCRECSTVITVCPFCRQNIEARFQIYL